MPRKWKDLCDTWAKRLGLAGRWHLRYSVRERLAGGAAATAQWNKGYQDAHIKFRKSETDKRGSAADAETYVVHEHVHLLLARLDDYVAEHWTYHSPEYRGYLARQEETCDELAALFLRAYSRKTRVV